MTICGTGTIVISASRSIDWCNKKILSTLDPAPHTLSLGKFQKKVNTAPANDSRERHVSTSRRLSAAAVGACGAASAPQARPTVPSTPKMAGLQRSCRLVAHELLQELCESGNSRHT